MHLKLAIPAKRRNPFQVETREELVSPSQVDKPACQYWLAHQRTRLRRAREYRGKSQELQASPKPLAPALRGEGLG